MKSRFHSSIIHVTWGCCDISFLQWLVALYQWSANKEYNNKPRTIGPSISESPKMHFQYVPNSIKMLYVTLYMLFHDAPGAPGAPSSKCSYRKRNKKALNQTSMFFGPRRGSGRKRCYICIFSPCLLLHPPNYSCELGFKMDHPLPSDEIE